MIGDIASENAGLVERNIQLMGENAKLTRTNDSLKEEVPSLKQTNELLSEEVATLKQNISSLSEKMKVAASHVTNPHTIEPLSDDEERILVCLAESDGVNAAIRDISYVLDLHEVKVQYWTEQLIEREMVRFSDTYLIGEEPPCYLDTNGREYLVKHNLV